MNVFEDMIQRSVPGYGLTLNLMASVAKTLKTDSPLCYDLGCSLGAGIIAIDRGLREKSGKIIGVDVSEPMITQANENLNNASLHSEWLLNHADINTVELGSHDLSVMNFTLQFIERDKRGSLVSKIYEALRPGGMFLLSEKVKFEDSAEQDFQAEMHHNFKRLNGYSDLEISQKRTALENRLIPETSSEHIARLKDAGFETAFTWFQAFNFTSFLAVK